MYGRMLAHHDHISLPALKQLAAGIVHWYGPLPEVNSQVTRALMVEIIAGSVRPFVVFALENRIVLRMDACEE